jgi:hypothetical protein
MCERRNRENWGWEMKKLAMVLLIAAGSALSGCAGTAAKVQTEYQLVQGEKLKLQLVTPPNATDEGVGILRERLNEQLSTNGLLAPATDDDARTIEVTVTNYYIRPGAVRATMGIMAGADNVQSTVKIKDSVGKVLSEYAVESKNPTAWGTSRGLLEKHADMIVETLQHGRK